jgi:hypothetical protein
MNRHENIEGGTEGQTVGRVSAWTRCDRPVRVTTIEAAHTILRMHHQCSGAVCLPRKSALRFLDDVNGSPGRPAHRG